MSWYPLETEKGALLVLWSYTLRQQLKDSSRFHQLVLFLLWFITVFWLPPLKEFQLPLAFARVWATSCCDGKDRWLGLWGRGGLLSAGDNYMLWKGQPWLVLGNRGELLSTFWKAGAMLERGWREPLMGLAEKQLLMRRTSVNFEVSHARISTIVVTSRMSRAEMTYLVRKEACV